MLANIRQTAGTAPSSPHIWHLCWLKSSSVIWQTVGLVTQQHTEVLSRWWRSYTYMRLFVRTPEFQKHLTSERTWLNGALENILEGAEVLLDGGWGNSGCIHICTRRLSVQLKAAKCVCVYIYICTFISCCWTCRCHMI